MLAPKARTSTAASTDNGKQNTYFSSLDNMVAQGMTKRRELCGQRPDGFGPRFHTKVDAAAKSLQIPVKADACHAR